MEIERDRKGRERHIHFGVLVVDDKYGLRLTKDNYAIVDNRFSFHLGRGTIYTVDYVHEHPDIYVIDEVTEINGKHYVTKLHYTDSWCEQHRQNCMRNLDLNMEFYASLDRTNFEKKVNAFLRKHMGFKPVSDLKEYEGVSGYYLMVLDEYKQVYIGTSDNIKKRIQGHWTIRKKFDRLLFGSVEESRISIDSFRALDTTRIYAYKTWNTYDKEDKYLRFFPDEYVCNRVAGGAMELGTLQAFGTRKKRELGHKG